MPETYPTALPAHDGRRPYGHHRLVLFALAMRLRVAALHSLAATALTDAPDGKPGDLVDVDGESGGVGIDQG
jgi:hypothetical protein